MKNRFLRVLLLLIMAAATSHAQVLTRAEYFVDADPGVGLATPVTVTPGDTVVKDFSFSTTSLPPGFHTVNVRTRDAAGQWDIVMSTWFYIYGTQYQPVILPRIFPITKAEYFYDNDPGEGLGISLPLIRGDTVDAIRYLRVNGLDTGYHYLYLRAMGENNLWGLAQRARFHVDTSTCTMAVPNFTYDTVTFGNTCHFTNLSTNITGGTQYQWDVNNDGTIESTAQNMTYTFTNPGYYKVKLIVANSPTCKTMILRDVVTGPLPNPAILIAGSTTLCKGDSVILTSDNYETGTTFDWSSGATTQAIKVKTTGDYFCWVKNIYGLSRRSVTVHVQVNDVPLVNLTYHNTTGGGANGSAWVGVSGGTGQYTYSWSNGTTVSILNGLSAGTYSVTVSDGHCPVIKNFSLTNQGVTTGNISAAEYYFDTDPGVGNGTPIVIWAADTVDFMTIPSLASLLPGYHNLYIRTRDTYGRWSLDMSAPFYIGVPVVNPPPLTEPQVTRAEYFFNNDPGVGNGLNIPVTTGDNITKDFAMPTTGLTAGFDNLFIRTRDANGRWSIYAGAAPFYVYDSQHHDLTKKYKSIAGAEYFFDTDPGVGNCNKIPSNIYDTIDMTRDIRVAGLTAGTHFIYLRAYDEKGFTGLWQRISFTVQNVTCTCPVVDFSVDTVHVLGNPTHFINLSTSVLSGATYQWDVNGDGVIDFTTASVNYTYAAYGLYNARLTVKNTDSCYASMTRQVVVSPVIDTSLTIVGALTFCDGNSVQIAAKPGYRYNWSSDQTTQSITVTQSGDYSVRLTNTYGVQGFSRVLHVVVYPLPVIQVVTIDASGGNANGTAICTASGGTGNYTYNWSNGNTLSIVNNLAPGNYTVTVSDGRCPVTSSCTINNHPVFPGDIVAAEYFFDTEPGVGNGIPMNIAGDDTVNYATLMPMGSLSQGFHTLCIRTQDTYGRWSIILTTQFYVYAVSPPGNGNQPGISRAEYFYDQDPGPGQGVPVAVTGGDPVTKDFAALSTGLLPGFHILSVRVVDSLHKWSIIATQEMYVYAITGILPPAVQPKIISAEYFFDSDPGAGSGTPIPFSPTGDTITLNRYLPVGGLTAGPHWVYLRAKDEGGKWGLCSRLSFNIIHTACTTPTPGFTIGPAIAGSPVTITNTSGNLISGTTYQWDINNDGTIDYTTKDISPTFAISGNYDVKLTVINSDTCKASILQQVFVGPLPPATLTITGNTTFCQGDSAELQASAGYSYKWWPTGQTTRSIWVKSSGTWYCWLTTNTGLEVKSQAVVITCNPVPSVTLHTINASGGSSNGSAWVDVSGGTGNYTYQWSSGSTAVYANNLAAGSYTVQVSDGYCPVVSSFIIGSHPVVRGNILAAEYFFDTDPGTGLGISMNISAADTAEYFTGCNVTGLPVGYHIVYIRVMDTYHSWSLYAQQAFYVNENQGSPLVINQPPIISSEYFVDLNINTKPDPGVGMGTRVSVIPGDIVDQSFGYLVDTLVVGFHYIATRVEDQGRKWSLIYPATFYIYDTTRRNIIISQSQILAAEYFLDSDPGAGNGTSLSITPGDLVTFNGGIPMGATPPGTHNLYVRVKDASKEWSIYARAQFGVYVCTQPHADFSFVQTCIGSPIHFIDQSTNVDPSATYAWDVNNDGIVDFTTHGNITYTYTVPGVYQCKLKITHNVACVDSVIKTVTFPFVHLPADTTIYTDQSLVLDGGPGYTYLWNTGATTQTITVNGATVGIGLHNYSVVVTNALSCTANDDINVTVTLPPRDLVVLSASQTPHVITSSGDSATLNCVIKNTGTISAVASVVQFYLSTDNTKSVDDQLLGFAIVNALAPGASQAIASRQLIPPGPEGQTWFILFVADGTNLVVESNENNNMLPASFFYGPGLNITVLNQNITSGQIQCFDAIQTLTVAGGGSTVYVQSGGSATFIAGQSITFLPGVDVFSGGYMHGYIATNSNQYCIPVPPISSMVVNNGLNDSTLKQSPPEAEIQTGDGFIKVFPNPTTGLFTLILSSGITEWPVRVKIINLLGTTILEEQLPEANIHKFSIAQYPPGIYILRVFHGNQCETVKIIRQ